MFLFNQFGLDFSKKEIWEPHEKGQKIKIMNYVSLLDIYGSAYIDMKVFFPDFIFASLKKDEKIYLLKMDIYGNVVNSGSIVGDRASFYFDYQKKYAWSVINANQDIYLVKWDFIYNPVDSYRLVIGDPLESVYPVFVGSKEIALWVDNKTLLWIWYDDNQIKNTLELSTTQNIYSVKNINFNPLIFNINQLDKAHSLILETNTFKQYLLRDCITISSCNTDNLTYLILNKDKNYYLALISKRNMQINSLNSFLISLPQDYQNYDIKTFQDYLVISFKNQDFVYITFFDKDTKIKNSFKISNLVEDYQIFSTVFGLFILSRYSGFPLMIKMDDRLTASNFLNFSICQAEINLNLIKDQQITLNPYEIFSKTKRMNLKIEKTNFNINKEEIFTKFYGTL